MILNYTAKQIEHTIHRPVTWERLTFDRKPIFCVCDFVPNYHFLNHDVIHKNCLYYEKNDNPIAGGPAADGLR